MTVKSTAERRRALLVEMQTTGAEAAYAAALQVCLDPKAPAPARATCATTILRAAGFLVARQDDVAEKEPHEMTPRELEDRIRELRSRSSDDDDVFG